MSGKKITEFLKSKERKSNSTTIILQVHNEEIQDSGSSTQEDRHNFYEQFRPPKNFNFPKRKIGQREHSCHYHWFKKYKWLHYEERYANIHIFF